MQRIKRDGLYHILFEIVSHVMCYFRNDCYFVSYGIDMKNFHGEDSSGMGIGSYYCEESIPNLCGQKKNDEERSRAEQIGMPQNRRVVHKMYKEVSDQRLAKV
jgi:hypothetical protein